MMKEVSSDIHRNEYRTNPYLGPYGGTFMSGPSYLGEKDIKKFSSDGGGGGWEMWPEDVHTSSLKKKKKSAALSALTLVAFLFFLNLLQSCLKEQMYSMNPTVSKIFVQTLRKNYTVFCR